MMQYHLRSQPMKICVEPPKDKDKVTKPNGVIAVIPTKDEAKEKRTLNILISVLDLITVRYVWMNM